MPMCWRALLRLVGVGDRLHAFGVDDGSMLERSTSNSWPTVLLRVPQLRFIASVNSSRLCREPHPHPTSRLSPTACWVYASWRSSWCLIENELCAGRHGEL